jgi:protein TonB
MRLLLLVGCLLVAVCSCSTDEPVQATDQAPEPEFAAFDTPPDPVDSVAPEYPDDARQAGATGRALVEVLVDASGHVASTRLIEPSGHPGLDAAAETAARQWTFHPARQGGKNVPATIAIPFQFELE